MNEESTNASREAVPTTLYERQVLLAFMPPSQSEQRMALACVLVMAVLFVVTAPFISTPLPQISTFIPIVETAVFICALITASLLFVRYGVSGAGGGLAWCGGEETCWKPLRHPSQSCFKSVARVDRLGC